MALGVHVPQYLWILYLGLSAVIFLGILYLIRRQAKLRGYSHFARELRSAPVVAVQMLSLALAATLSLTGFLRPYLETEAHEPIWNRGSFVIMADCSRSMLAPVSRESPDTSRLDVMKEAIAMLLEQLVFDKKAVGCFAGSLLELSPLSTDYGDVRPWVVGLSHQYVQAVGSGTNFAAAIGGCFLALEKSTSADNACIVISDGEPDGDLSALEREFAELEHYARSFAIQSDQNVSFFLVPVGDPDHYLWMPLRDENGNVYGYLQDTEGSNIETKPNYPYLERIAASLGGRFIAVSDHNKLLEELEKVIDASRTVERLERRVRRVDITPHLVVVAASLLFISLGRPKKK